MSETLFTMPLAVFGLGPWEVVAIAIVALLLFGKRLPEVARSAGKAVIEFKKGLRDVESEVESTDQPKNAQAAELPKPEDKRIPKPENKKS